MSKYNAKKVTVDGIVFDSLAEAKYYELLKFQKAVGQIADFKIQPEYVLIGKFKKNGKTYRGSKYIADFEIILNDGSLKVVDVKGYPTPLFKFKAKLFLSLYPHCLYIAKYYKRKDEFVEEVF